MNLAPHLLLSVPDDSLIHTFSFLHPSQILLISATCREFRRLATNDFLWREILQRRAGGMDRWAIDCESEIAKLLEPFGSLERLRLQKNPSIRDLEDRTIYFSELELMRTHQREETLIVDGKIEENSSTVLQRQPMESGNLYLRFLRCLECERGEFPSRHLSLLRKSRNDQLRGLSSLGVCIGVVYCFVPISAMLLLVCAAVLLVIESSITVYAGQGILRLLGLVLGCLAYLLFGLTCLGWCVVEKWRTRICEASYVEGMRIVAVLRLGDRWQMLKTIPNAFASLKEVRALKDSAQKHHCSLFHLMVPVWAMVCAFLVCVFAARLSFHHGARVVGAILPIVLLLLLWIPFEVFLCQSWIQVCCSQRQSCCCFLFADQSAGFVSLFSLCVCLLCVILGGQLLFGTLASMLTSNYVASVVLWVFVPIPLIFVAATVGCALIPLACSDVEDCCYCYRENCRSCMCECCESFEECMRERTDSELTMRRFLCAFLVPIVLLWIIGSVLSTGFIYSTEWTVSIASVGLIASILMAICWLFCLCAANDAMQEENERCWVPPG